MFKLAIVYTSLATIPLLVEFFLKKYEKKNYINCDNTSYYKCMFTSANNVKCRQHIYDKISCSATCSYNMLKNIVEFIQNSSKSISMCMYLLTSYEICNALIACHKQGKKVRVIVDERMWGCSSSKGRILQQNGNIASMSVCIFFSLRNTLDVPIKVQNKDGSMMHHKFCLIDENTPYAKLFIGTVNLTLQGLCQNWDTFVYTNNREIMERLKEEFEELWLTFCTYECRG